MKIGVIADDFTGGSDIALTLANSGMSVIQYVGVPANAANSDVDCGVVALKIRSVAVEAAVSEALQACEWLLAQGCTQIVYKICSTFDSTAEGNIGPVSAALADRLGETTVLVCPAFPENGRSVYQGHLFVFDRLLHESGMQNHPLTPMRDADIRRVLGTQTSWPIGHIQIRTVASGHTAIAEAAQALGHGMIIVDAIQDMDLIAIGRAARNRRLLVGGSGIALGLPANFSMSETASGWSPVTGAGVVLSGSCSTATRQQIAHYADNAPSYQLDSDKIIEGRVNIDALVQWILTQNTSPIVYSGADPKVVDNVQKRHGRENSAAAIEQFFSTLAAKLANAGVRKIVVAGGETSGAVVSGLRAQALEIGPQIAPGVPAVKLEGRDLALALKSGNFGQPDFFIRALKMLGGEP